jgi:hypothetical protein
MPDYFAKAHDILKLCDRYQDSKIHYCPDCIGVINNDLLNQIRTKNGFRALKHHCVFRFSYKQHCCNSEDFYQISKEDFLLAIADVKASAISRKLNIAFRRGAGKHKRIIWNTYHLWIYKKIDECIGQPPDDTTLLNEIVNSNNINEVFENRKEQIQRRSEDAWKCPFASLMTHSLLTEKWYNFLIKNSDYLNVPDQINSVSDALKISSDIQGSTSKKYPKEGLPIYFVRLKLFANQSLSRIADVEIIRQIEEIIESIPNYFYGSQELYTLYDEIVFVIPDPGENVKSYIERTLQSIERFTTNYYFEGNFSRKTRLLRKDLLLAYDDLFKEFEHNFYPPLKQKIAPDLREIGENNIEAYRSKLCELCNMAEAKKTFWKFNEEEEKKKIHECLCQHCFNIRDNQKRINEAIEKGEEVPHGIGYKIAKWENERPDSRLCFIKIDLNLNLLNELFKKILLREFPLERYKDKFNDENIGFSIIYEFLNKFKEEFLPSLKSKITQGKFSKIDEKTGISNEFDILDNFICLRFDDMSEMKVVLKEFVDTYTTFFPQFKGLYDSKNVSDDGKNKKAVFPINFSATISNIKFPFFEAWQYLNQQKENLVNILTVRNFELVMDYREYQKLSWLNFEDKEISSFLHKLAEIDERSRSELLINTEIYNQNEQGEIFSGVNRFYSIKQLINFFKLTRKNYVYTDEVEE